MSASARVELKPAAVSCAAKGVATMPVPVRVCVMCGLLQSEQIFSLCVNVVTAFSVRSVYTVQMSTTGGRIDISSGYVAPFVLYAEGTDGPCDAASEATRGVHAPGALAQLFFSGTNVEALQLGLRNMVYARSSGRHVIGRQSEAELRIIMRAVYLQHASHRGFEVVDEVRELNGRVLDYAVPRVLSELEAHTQYLRDVSAPPAFMPPAMATSVKGERTLEMSLRV